MNNPQPLLSSTPHRSRPRRFLLSMMLVLIVTVLLVWQFQRSILDWASLRGYAAPATVAALASADTMTSGAVHVFYVNHPSIDSKVVFAGHCNFGREQSIVIGCYHGNQQGIYLLNVSDPRLAGVEQVTAAHEMLHAAYDRLSPSERTHIDTLLQNFYTTKVTDARVRATIDLYRKTEPHDVVNEMHSIFGTEIAQLTPELETYYRRYFTDRAQIVSYAAAYSQEFVGRQEQVASYDAELKRLKMTIDANTASLDQEQATLQAMRSRLDAERNTNPRQYNRDVDGYNAQVNTYNALIVTTRNLITQYNAVVDKRNAIALEEQQLARAISGDSVPASQ